jgi:hypothetical protein
MSDHSEMEICDTVTARILPQLLFGIRWIEPMADLPIRAGWEGNLALHIDADFRSSGLSEDEMELSGIRTFRTVNWTADATTVTNSRPPTRLSSRLMNPLCTSTDILRRRNQVLINHWERKSYDDDYGEFPPPPFSTVNVRPVAGSCWSSNGTGEASHMPKTLAKARRERLLRQEVLNT